MPSPEYRVWDVNNDWPFPREVMLSCLPEVVRILEWAHAEGIEQRTPGWYARRNQLTVSGSILNDIVGKGYADKRKDSSGKGTDGWNTCFLSKVGLDPAPFNGNKATLHGQKYEDEAFDKWCKQEGMHGFTMGLLQHPGYDYMGGSPDGLTARGNVVEIKCPLNRWIKVGEFPSYYDLQPRFYSHLMGMQAQDSVFLQYKPGEVFGFEVLDHVMVPFNPEYTLGAIKTAENFNTAVQEARKTGVVPESVLEFRRFAVKRRLKYDFGRTCPEIGWPDEYLDDLFKQGEPPLSDAGMDEILEECMMS